MTHRLFFLTLLACGLALVSRPASAQDGGASAGSKHVTLALSTDPATPPPGQTFQLNTKVVIAPKTHIYGKTIQGIGKPTALKLSLPAGWQQESLPWPATKAIDSPDGPTQAYDGTIIISVKITPKPDATTGKISAVLDGLACDDQMCMPFKASTALSVALKGK